MNEFLRTKIKVLSFFLVVLVVFVHSYNIGVRMGTWEGQTTLGINYFLQEFFCNGFNRIASPLFFIISGYLFFVNITGKRDDFIRKVKKRFITLIIPYLFWSLWGILFYWILQTLPETKMLFTKGLIKEYGLQKLLNTIFLDPIPYQLWYVRDLTVFAILSPIIYLIIKYLKIYAVLFFMVMWFYDFHFVVFRSQSILFFVLGAFISTKNEWFLKPGPPHRVWIFTPFWILILLFKTWLVYSGSDDTLLLTTLHKIAIVFGVLSIHCIYDTLFRNVELAKKNAFKIVSFSFFLFASHEPIITVFKKGFFLMTGDGEIASFVIFLAAPMLTILLCLLVGYYLKRLAPNFYGTITGWR